MGNLCFGQEKKSKEIGDDTEKESEVIEESPLVEWEEKQKQKNDEIFKKLKEDFLHRPDNFILNMLVVSTQFYKNFDREKTDVRNTILNREKHFNEKLASSSRSVIFMGGFEEIAGTHVLYQDPENTMLELPTSLQIFILQENVHVFGEDQLEELLTATYAEEEGLVYRLSEERAKRHPGYVRLRCTDAIPGLSRSNTYEDIYSLLPKPDEHMPDPIMDLRPIRRSSSVSEESQELNDMYDVAPGMPNYENKISNNLPIDASRLTNRRSSGILPMAFQWKKTEPQNNSNKTKPFSNSSERRPSGVFPKMNPGMERVVITKPKVKKFEPADEKFTKLNKILSKIEEDDEEEDEEEEEEEYEEKDEENEDTEEEDKEEENDYDVVNIEKLKNSYDDNFSKASKQTDQSNKIILSQAIPKSDNLNLTIQKECFIKKKIKLRSVNDAYGISSNSELRTYLSSNRYLDIFEEDFLTLLEILQKDYLYDTCEMQTPAIHVTDTMIEKQGPIFNTEYIPSLLVKRWPNCAFEWKWRNRQTNIDEETQTIYKWPLDHKIEEAAHLGCNLVPIGYYNPKEPTKTMQIEWQIQFSKAEKVLLRSLGHMQIRILLLAEVLIRDHLGERTQLRTQHLRYILFYMCEHNFKDWYEERLGNKLKSFLKTLYTCLSKENFPHYFVVKCNMMDSFPGKDVRLVQSTVKKLTDHLPLCLMQTLHRLRTADDFYPRLDIKKLYKIITPKNYHGNMAPSLLAVARTMSQSDEDLSNDDSATESEDEEDQALKKKLKAEYKRRQSNVASHSHKVQQQQKQQQQQKRKGLNLTAKIQPLTDNRSEEVLKYFADHFVAMARFSNNFQAYAQAYMYLLLAGNMASLLEENNNSEEAELYRKIINKINLDSREGVADMLGTTLASKSNDKIELSSPQKSNWEFKNHKSETLLESPSTSNIEHEPKKINTKNIKLAASLSSLHQSRFTNDDSDSGDDLDLTNFIETPEAQHGSETPRVTAEVNEKLNNSSYVSKPIEATPEKAFAFRAGKFAYPGLKESLKTESVIKLKDKDDPNVQERRLTYPELKEDLETSTVINSKDAPDVRSESTNSNFKRDLQNETDIGIKENSNTREKSKLIGYTLSNLNINLSNDSRKDSNTSSRKGSNPTPRKDSNPTFRNDPSFTSSKDYSTISSKDSIITSRKDSSTTSRNDSSPTSRNDSSTTSRNDSSTTSRNDSSTSSRFDSNTISEIDTVSSYGKDSSSSRKDSYTPSEVLMDLDSTLEKLDNNISDDESLSMTTINIITNQINLEQNKNEKNSTNIIKLKSSSERKSYSELEITHL